MFTAVTIDSHSSATCLAFGRWYEKLFFLWRWVRSDWDAEFGTAGRADGATRDAGITIPAAGHMIRLRLGVVLGAPAFFQPLSLVKHILLFLGHVVRDGQSHIYLFPRLTLAVGRPVSGFRTAPFWRRRHCPVKDYPPRKSPPPSRYGFRNDGGESGGHSGRHLPEL